MSDYNKRSNSYSKNEKGKNNHGGHNNHKDHKNSNQGQKQANQPKAPVKPIHNEPPISTFMLGEKEMDEKVAQFHYDKGNYSIVDIVGEEKNVVYKSRNSQEAYQKWNVYIGRKKERMSRADREKEKEQAN